MSPLGHRVAAGPGRVDLISAIVAFKVVKILFLVALAIAAFVLAESNAYALLFRAVRWLGLDGSRRVSHVIALAGRQPPSHIVLAGIGALCYAAVFAVEAWGLHRRLRWAEWLTVVVTASALPFEIYELVHHTSAGKIAVLIINVLVIVYLVRVRVRERRRR
jgi:uncharacterized membrane protein (DUF2068 family)